MVKRTKMMIGAGTVALALAGTGAGVAAAQTTTTPAAPSTPTNQAPANPATGAKHTWEDHGGWMGKDHGGLGRVVHGEFTVHTTTGDKVMDVQRGVVTAINATSVTVKSTDGYSATYTIDPTTKVYKAKMTAAAAQIATNDEVKVQATKTSAAVTAQHIGDAGPTPAK